MVAVHATALAEKEIGKIIDASASIRSVKPKPQMFQFDESIQH
jgi:hypothetical protein